MGLVVGIPIVYIQTGNYCDELTAGTYTMTKVYRRRPIEPIHLVLTDRRDRQYGVVYVTREVRLLPLLSLGTEASAEVRRTTKTCNQLEQTAI